MSIPQVNSGNFQRTETHQANPANADSRFSTILSLAQECTAMKIEEDIPHFIEDQFELGTMHLDQSEYKSAIECFEAIPDSSELYAAAQHLSQLARIRLTQIQ
jgi:hypothetical protein